jgi:zinc protease
MGADLRLETSPDSTAFSLLVPTEHLEPALELMGEVVREPAFPAKEVVAARRRTLARLQTDLDDPSILAADALYRVALGRHPYAHPGRGRAREVRTFTRSDCVAWHGRMVRPAGATLVLAGDVQGQEALSLARSLFGGWESPVVAHRPLPRVPPIEGQRILLVDRPEANQAQVRLASIGPERLYPQIIAARLSAQILGGSFSSRLVDAIRVNRGLSYGVSSYLTESEAGGLFVVSSYTKNETLRELVDVAIEETARYRASGPGAEELSRAQRYFNGLFPLAMERGEQLARALAEVKRHGRSFDWLERRRERVAAVTLDEAAAEARRFFLPGGWAASVVGRAKDLAPQLAGLGRVQVVSAEKL